MSGTPAAGKRVETVKGVLAGAEGRAVVASFQDHQAAQCGVCTPGMMVSKLMTAALLTD